MKGRLDIVTLLGGPAPDEDESSSDLALKAMFKAIQKDDFDKFKSAFKDAVKYCGKEASSSDEDSEDDDY